ncbi:nucleoside recognition domain-containing protein [Paenibacillus validus]|uniref:nucleoside recognition domain-containing protein n=1 Tax=Paenibacillus validus TaxID=44253 RepID=UPI003D273835
MRKTNPGLQLAALAAVLLACMMLIFPEPSFRASIKGIAIWWDVLFPALFPFFVISEMMLGIGIVHFFGTLLDPMMRPLFRVPGIGGFVMAMGFASGYPIGARLTSQLWDQRIVTREEGERLVAFYDVVGSDLSDRRRIGRLLSQPVACRAARRRPLRLSRSRRFDDAVSWQAEGGSWRSDPGGKSPQGQSDRYMEAIVSGDAHGQIAGRTNAWRHADASFILGSPIIVRHRRLGRVFLRRHGSTGVRRRDVVHFIRGCKPCCRAQAFPPSWQKPS